MSALDLNVDEYRSRLAQRTSFFGGSVSTRKEAAAPGWKAKKSGATGGGVSPSSRQQQAPAVSQGRRPGQSGLKRALDVQPEDGDSVAHAKAEAKRKRLAYARDYGALQAGTSTQPSLGSPPVPIRQAKSLPSKRPAVPAPSPVRHSAAAQWLASASPSRSSSPAIRTLQGSRSMPSSKGGSRGSPGVRAAQGGRKAAFGRASAKAPGRSSLSQAQRAAESLRAAVSASISTLSPGSQHGGGGSSSNGSASTAQAAAASAQNRALLNGVKAAPRASNPAASRELPAGRKDDAVVAEPDWRRELREITGYDPSRFRDEPLDDWRMEAGWRDVQAEERRSERVGAADDRREEAAEAARQAAKTAARAAGRKAEQRR